MRSRGLVLVLAPLLAGCAASSPPEPAVSPGRPPVGGAALERAVERLKAARPLPVDESVVVRVWSPQPSQRWTLRGAGGPLCALPCTRRLLPGQLAVVRESDQVRLEIPDELGPPGGTVDVHPRPGRGSPVGALVVGGAGANALVFGGILATGFCRDSPNNTSRSAGGCTASLVAAGTGAAMLIGAIVWGQWSRSPSVEVKAAPE